MSLSTRSKTWLARLAMCAAMCCGSAALAQPSNPANDLCSGAIPLTVNTLYFGNTNSATQLNDGPAAPCQATSNNRGLWYTFVAPATARYQISASGSRIDTVLAVYSAVDCTGFNNAAFVLVPGGCNDDEGGTAFGPGAAGNSLSSAISNIQLTASQTYYIRLSGFSNTTTGHFQIGVFNYTSYGACCSTAGVCTIAMPSLCGVINGSSVFLGDGSTCSPTNPCTGACCNNTTFACSITFPGTGTGGCLSGNTWQGFGTTCAAACTSGACCTSGAVCTTTTFGQCATTSNFQPGVACGSGNAACYPMGACCLTTSPFTCVVFASGTACPSGTFQGFGTTCPASFVCDTGACCSTTSTCSVTVLSGCTGASKFLPGGTCGTNPCSQACCNTTTFVCSVVTGACPAGSLTLGNTSACSGTSCASGACCTTAGVCSVVAGELCAGTSQFVGVGSTCAVNPCTGACCDNTTLACSVVVVGTAGCAGQGLFTTCSPTDPCASLGKCCTSSGTCTLSVAAGCASTNVYTAGVSCTPNDCATFFGSCCNTATFVCSLASSAGNCTGTFAGLNTTCTTNPCPAPSNDLCANAAVIPAGGPFPYSVQGQNATSADTAAFTPAVCVTSARDVWYTFTPSTTAAYSFTLCNAYSGTLDTVLSIHDACPVSGDNNLHPSFSPNCNDDGCSGSAGPSALGGLTMNAGSTYLIRVAKWSTGAGGVFQLDITTEPFGACCDTALVCSLKTQSLCTGTAGSIFVGGGTLCSTSGICNGACCNGATGSCTFTAAASCLSPSVHGGVGSTCTSAFCPVTTCCNNATGACTVTGTDPCPSGTTANAATSCSPLPCTVSACCNNATGACTLTGSDPCPSGTTANAATSCSPTPCTTATCCSNATGACTVTGTDPCPSGSTFNASTTCSPSPCTISTCCDNATGICTTTGTDPCPSGTTANAATACSPSPCPAPANDVCGNVYPGPDTIPGGGGSVPCNLTSSTNDGNSTCQSTAGKDVYFLFTPTVTGAYNLTTCSGSDAIDTLISIHVPGCPVNATVGTAPGNQIDTTANSACVDQGCSGGGNLSNIASYTLTGGTQYMIRVALWSSSGTTGSATLTVTLLTATGSCCDNATGTCSLTFNSAACASTATANASTTCSPSPCVAVAICCNNSTGACAAIFGGVCGTGTTQGTGTVCGGGAPDANCPAVACCDAIGICSITYAGSCAAGSPAPGGTCSPNPCAALPSVCENFDASASLPAGWTTTTTGGGAVWAIVTDSTHSAPNAVFTDDVAGVSSQFLQLPSVTIGGTVLGVDFWASYSTEDTFDGWTLEISSDGGTTFTNVGDVAWTLNGYTDTISTAWGSPISGQRAFSGAALTWTQHTAVVGGLTPGNSYIFRFHMACDQTLSATGVWIDDVCLYYQPNAGACCEIATGLCTTTAPGACGSGFNFVGGACSPNPCPPPPGVCCRGATCSTAVTMSANCTVLGGANAGAYWATPFSACNASGNTTSPCCFADYDKMNGIQVVDIFAFLNDWFAGYKYAIPGGNGTHGTLAVQNIFDFLNLWFAGGC